jgi:hypothetical protein
MVPPALTPTDDVPHLAAQAETLLQEEQLRMEAGTGQRWLTLAIPSRTRTVDITLTTATSECAR